MSVQVREVGRNDRCPCGSGKKYKQCCAARVNGWSRRQLTILAVVAIVLVGGLVLSFTSRHGDELRQTGVWSEEHGHYH